MSGVDILRATASSVTGVTSVELPLRTDPRGTLSFGEIGQHLPYAPKRYFTIHGIEGGALRGDHAHRTLHQFFVCLHGKCRLRVDDGTTHQDFILDSPATGIHAPPMTWCTVETFDEHTVLLCLASDIYVASDYIHDRAEFARLCAERTT